MTILKVFSDTPEAMMVKQSVLRRTILAPTATLVYGTDFDFSVFLVLRTGRSDWLMAFNDTPLFAH